MGYIMFDINLWTILIFVISTFSETVWQSWVPEIVVPLNHPFVLLGIFHYEPSSYWGSQIFGSLNIIYGEYLMFVNDNYWLYVGCFGLFQVYVLCRDIIGYWYLICTNVVIYLMDISYRNENADILIGISNVDEISNIGLSKISIVRMIIMFLLLRWMIITINYC